MTLLYALLCTLNGSISRKVTASTAKHRAWSEKKTVRRRREPKQKRVSASTVISTNTRDFTQALKKCISNRCGTRTRSASMHRPRGLKRVRRQKVMRVQVFKICLNETKPLTESVPTHPTLKREASIAIIIVKVIIITLVVPHVCMLTVDNVLARHQTCSLRAHHSAAAPTRQTLGTCVSKNACHTERSRRRQPHPPKSSNREVESASCAHRVVPSKSVVYK